jgi:hypothetical protein
LFLEQDYEVTGLQVRYIVFSIDERLDRLGVGAHFPS